MGFDGENCVERCSSDWFRYGRGVYDESVPFLTEGALGKWGDDRQEILAAMRSAGCRSERAKNESRWMKRKLIADVL